MRSRTTRVLLVVGSMLAGVSAAFAALQSWYRGVETSTAVAVLHALGTDRVSRFTDAMVLVRPAGKSAFQVVVTPSCSALASICAFACIWPLTARFTFPRRVTALVVAALTVAAGNIVRIVTSLAVGLAAGKSSLVLFHDWVGSSLSFGYTLFGFMLMLFVLLPAEKKASVAHDLEGSVVRAA